MPAITPPTNNYIGANLMAARTAAGLTQLALAHAIGWTGPDAGAHISNYETGKNEPRISTLRRMAEVLGVNIDNLLSPPAKAKK